MFHGKAIVKQLLDASFGSIPCPAAGHGRAGSRSLRYPAWNDTVRIERPEAPAGAITQGASDHDKVSVLYPYSDGYRFDLDYYCNRHMPMVKEKLGDACQGIAVDHGLSGGAAGSAPHHVVMAHLFFDSVEAFQNAFAPHAEAIMGDIPNYTGIQPIILISEVLINARRSETGPFHLHGSGSAA